MSAAAVAPNLERPVFRIVLAEDNAADVMLVRMALREAGIECELTVLQDGEQAIRFIEALEANPGIQMDLLLLDMHLPRLDGDDILRRLRASKSRGDTPVVVITAAEAPRGASESGQLTRHFRKSPAFGDYMRLGSLVRAALG